MKKYNPIYYLLFILLVTGAFASMAQNNYGLKIMGAASILFGLVFFIEFITLLRRKEKMDLYTLLEPVCLFLLSVIFALRIFYIRFPYVELLFAGTALLLLLIYIRKMILLFSQFRSKNASLAMVLASFHLSIILFLGSLVIAPFTPKIAEIIATAGFILLLGFIILGFLRGKWLVYGENISAFGIVTRFKDHSIIIISFFLLFSLYVAFNRVGVLPDTYSDEFPQAYFDLVNQAESKEEKPVDGRYRYEEFKEKYDLFMKRNNIKD